jgi:hypothetical protein
MHQRSAYLPVGVFVRVSIKLPLSGLVCCSILNLSVQLCSCLGDDCPSSALYGPVRFGQVRLGGDSGQCGLLRFSRAWWNDRENDHLSKRSERGALRRRPAKLHADKQLTSLAPAGAAPARVCTPCLVRPRTSPPQQRPGHKRQTVVDLARLSGTIGRLSWQAARRGTLRCGRPLSARTDEPIDNWDG